MTNTVTPKVETPAETPVVPAAEAFQAEHSRLLHAVSKNPAQVEFPADVWGMTTELRKAGLRVAGSIRGNEEKLRVYLATLSILGAHAVARVDDDKASNADRLAANERLSLNERVYGKPVPAPLTEPAVTNL